MENKEKSSSVGAVNGGPRRTCSVTEERRGGREIYTQETTMSSQSREGSSEWSGGLEPRRSSESEKVQLQQDDSGWCESVNISSLVSSLILATTLEAGVASPILQVRKTEESESLLEVMHPVSDQTRI